MEELAYALFPGTPAFTLAGDEGRERLLSALAQPHWPQHRTLQDKAAVLHWHLNRDHPYIDGNKRLAVAALETFLFVNRASLIATDEELKRIALAVADGTMSQGECRALLRARCVRLDWHEDRIVRWAAGLRDEDKESVDAYLVEHDPFERGDRIYRLLRSGPLRGS